MILKEGQVWELFYLDVIYPMNTIEIISLNQVNVTVWIGYKDAPKRKEKFSKLGLEDELHFYDYKLNLFKTLKNLIKKKK